ncbi:hypothetical protein IAT40_001700 [Kwoniella sp. CBS 6097]
MKITAIVSTVILALGLGSSAAPLQARCTEILSVNQILSGNTFTGNGNPSAIASDNGNDDGNPSASASGNGNGDGNPSATDNGNPEAKGNGNGMQG